ncbi:MAG: hypothetical protein IT464_07525 [Planctomycetes bacterium]|nr:hypothetical protein [Planctomycetota bacterium]
MLAASLSAQPASIDTFPYTPDNTAEGADFVANYGTGPTTSGSTWTQGSVSSPRQGSSGAGSTAWACLPTSNYANNTVTWLHSPIFDFTGVSGMQLQFELWVKVRSYDGAKLQVSTNGGSAWSDVSALSVSYNGTCALIATKFGGSSNCWTGTGLGGGSANTCSVNLNAWSGQSDVRFRWCFVAEDTEKASPDNGPVVDSPRVVAVTSSVAYANGFAAVPQGATVEATITKVGGDDFVGGMTVDVAGTGVTGTVTSVNSVDEIEVDFSATRVADVGPHTFWIKNGSTNICQGTVEVYHPHQRVPARDGSVQEPPQNAAMGANGVYLHNGEFRHDLPFVSIPGRMLPLAVGGTYRSRYESLGWLGAGWTVSFDQRLYYHSGGDEIDLYSGSGRIDTFELESGGTAGEGPYVKAGFFFEIARDNNGTQTKTDDVFTITYAHGSTATFEAVHIDIGGDWAYRITEFADRYGNAVEYVYDGDGYLTEIRGDMYDSGSPSVYRLVIAYNAHGRVATITDYADYSGQSSVIGGSYTDERVWEFIYNSDAQLTDIKLPKTERYDSETKGSDYRTRVQFTYASSSDRMEEVIDARQADLPPDNWSGLK